MPARIITTFDRNRLTSHQIGGGFATSQRKEYQFDYLQRDFEPINFLHMNNTIY